MKLIHFILLSIILISLYNVEYGFSQTREESSSDSEKFVKTHPELRSSQSLKIHSLLFEWQSSSTPEVFARNNNLSVSDNKIQVYIYLDSADSIVNIPQDIDVIDSNENIAIAFVSSEQINQLTQLDFVVKISPPIRAIISPIPISQEDDGNDNFALIGIGIIIAVIIVLIYSKKRKGNRN